MNTVGTDAATSFLTEQSYEKLRYEEPQKQMAENSVVPTPSKAVPVDSVDISDEAKALASNERRLSKITLLPKSKNTNVETSEAASESSGSRALIEVQIKALEKKIAALQKEILEEMRVSRNDEASQKRLQLKQVLLSAYQAQLIELQEKLAKAM